VVRNDTRVLFAQVMGGRAKCWPRRGGKTTVAAEAFFRVLRFFSLGKGGVYLRFSSIFCHKLLFPIFSSQIHHPHIRTHSHVLLFCFVSRIPRHLLGGLSEIREGGRKEGGINGDGKVCLCHGGGCKRRGVKQKVRKRKIPFNVRC